MTAAEQENFSFNLYLILCQFDQVWARSILASLLATCECAFLKHIFIYGKVWIFLNHFISIENMLKDGSKSLAKICVELVACSYTQPEQESWSECMKDPFDFYLQACTSIVYILVVQYSIVYNSIYIVKSARLILSNFLLKAVLLGLRQVLKSLQKLCKMLFIPPEKLFSFSRYLSFCL